MPALPERKMKSRTFLLVLLIALGLVLPLHAQQGHAGATAQSTAIANSGPFNGSTLSIPMRDGRSLAADIFLPKSGGKHPVVLVQTPYDKNLVRPWFAGEGRWGPDSIFTDPNYAFVITDWRGKFASSGALTPGTQANLSQDGYDTCSWIAKQEWCNGKIATWGPSALGRVQYETARANPPNLVCAVPIVMPLNLDYDIYFPGGALWEEFLSMLGRLGFGTQLYNQVTARAVRDDTWKVVERTFVRPEEFQVPMLFIGGWYDIYTDGVLNAFAAVRAGGGPKARAHSKLVMGPWLHNTDQLTNGQMDFPKGRLYGMKKARDFFDCWVRETANDFDTKEPSISYYQMGVDEWRATGVWPPAGVRDGRYYLHEDRSLSMSAPQRAAAPASFRYDPASPVPTLGGHVLDPALKGGPQDQREKVESRDDVLVYSTPALTTDLPVTGKIKLELHVSSDRLDTDFTAIVTDVYPDGRSMLVTEGIRRMRFRNTTSREDLMKPGEVYPVGIELTNTAITFLKGHRVRVIISSSNYPKYALNLNDGGPMYKKGKGVVATNSVYADARHLSALVLPVGER
jgi:predicted acyl esterase